MADEKGDFKEVFLAWQVPLMVLKNEIHDWKIFEMTFVNYSLNCDTTQSLDGGDQRFVNISWALMTYLALGPYDHDKMCKMQVLKVWHMELCSMSCGSLDGREVWGRMDICVCMAESFHCSPKTITKFLITIIMKLLITFLLITINNFC